MKKPLFGASTLSWIAPTWTDESVVYAIEKTAHTGFDVTEILLPIALNVDVKLIRDAIKKCHIQVDCGLNLNKDYHIPAHPKEAVDLVKKAIDITEQLGSNYLGGVLHGGIGCFTGVQRTLQEENILVDAWGEIAAYALPRGIDIGVEPINRYESYVCTSIAETLALQSRVDAPNLKVHLDTFHANIEENGFYHPVLTAGSQLRHVHMTESDRGMLGEGNVHWDDLFKGLAEIKYAHHLVLENFTNQIPGMASATSLWRPSKYDADDLAKGSLLFMQEMVDKWFVG